jgi:hypothetical protein
VETKAAPQPHVITVKAELRLDPADLYLNCFDAYQWAQAGGHKPGSSDWLTMFTDRLGERLSRRLSIEMVGK